MVFSLNSSGVGLKPVNPGTATINSDKNVFKVQSNLHHIGDSFGSRRSARRARGRRKGLARKQRAQEAQVEQQAKNNKGKSRLRLTSKVSSFINGTVGDFLNKLTGGMPLAEFIKTKSNQPDKISFNEYLRKPHSTDTTKLEPVEQIAVNLKKFKNLGERLVKYSQDVPKIVLSRLTNAEHKQEFTQKLKEVNLTI